MREQKTDGTQARVFLRLKTLHIITLSPSPVLTPFDSTKSMSPQTTGVIGAWAGSHICRDVNQALRASGCGDTQVKNHGYCRGIQKSSDRARARSAGEVRILRDVFKLTIGGRRRKSGVNDDKQTFSPLKKIATKRYHTILSAHKLPPVQNIAQRIDTLRTCNAVPSREKSGWDSRRGGSTSCSPMPRSSSRAVESCPGSTSARTGGTWWCSPTPARSASAAQSNTTPWKKSGHRVVVGHKK